MQPGDQDAAPAGAQKARGGTPTRLALSPPLIETTRGWLMLYHGVRHTASGSIRRRLGRLDEHGTAS